MTLQATFCSTLVDEWVRAGVTHAVISPGSRNAPLTIAILSDSRLETHFRLDERSAGFFALGIAIDSGAPVVVVTTSGTAAAELHAAVIEADLARVPLIVATADRPFELYDVGAPQTIVQPGLFGAATRFTADAGVADAGGAMAWRSFAARLVLEATSSPRGAGPVHVNLPFRDPLVGEPDELPPGRPEGRPWHEVAADRGAGALAVDRFSAAVTGRRGVIVVGGPIGDSAGRAVLRFAEEHRWPIFADARAIPRVGSESLIAHADGIVRSVAVRAACAPEVVVHVGAPHASKALTEWCVDVAEMGIPHVLIDPYGSFEDPERSSSIVLRSDPEATFYGAMSVAPAPKEWVAMWRALDDAAEVAIARTVDLDGPLTEPGIVRSIFASTNRGGIVFASSSMPVRDFEWFAAARPGAPTLLSNRGANGIDGVTSTALGVAVSAGRRSSSVVAVTGDLAFLYDLSALVIGTHEEVPDLTVVVIDNGGGGIFNFLPYPGVLDDATFERAFGTPQRPGIVAVVEGLGHRAVVADTSAELALAVKDQPSGITVVVARTDRAANVELHALVERCVVAAVEDALGSR